MANVNIRLGDKDQDWFDDNPTLVLLKGQVVFLEGDSGLFKKGDGVTELQDLPFLGSVGAATTQLLTGGVITIGTYGGSGTNNDIRVTASTYFIEAVGTFSAAQTDFLDIALSASGNQRYIGLYGNNSGTITKIEGTEAALATFPSTPADTCLIGYVLVTDAATGTIPDPSDTKMDKRITENEQTDNYTLVLSDENKNVNMNKATAVNLTVPPNSSVPFEIGTQLIFMQGGAGQVTIVPGSGVTIRCYNSRNKTSGQYAGGSLVKREPNTWWMEGNLTT